MEDNATLCLMVKCPVDHRSGMTRPPVKVVDPGIMLHLFHRRDTVHSLIPGAHFFHAKAKYKNTIGQVKGAAKKKDGVIEVHAPVAGVVMDRAVGRCDQRFSEAYPMQR